jgi:hypothetical protein
MNNILLYKIVVLILLIKTTIVFSQEPMWMSKIPQDYLNDYFVVSGSSTYSETEAEEMAYRTALERISDSRGIIFEASPETIIQDNPNIRKGGGIVELKGSSIKTGTSTIITDFKIWDRYSKNENGLFTVWLKVSIPKEHPISPPSPFSPVWRSIALPGWGQFYKGQPTRGYIIALSEAILIPAGIILQNLKSTAEVDARNSPTQVLRNYYTDEANTYLNLSTAAYVLAGAIYIYNIVDAIVSDGEKVYVYEQQQKSNMISITENLLPKPQYKLTINFRF